MNDALNRAWRKISRFGKRVWDVLVRALVKYNETDAEQRAASFAYYAFFSLFPLLLLLISIGAMVLGDQEKATRAVINSVQAFTPVEEGQANWFVDTITGVIKSRRSAGTIAFFALAWSAVRFFQSLVRGVNKAWGTKEYSWWHLPIQNLFMVGIVASALFLGVIIPPAIDVVQFYYWQNSWKFGLSFKFVAHVFWWTKAIIPTLVIFYGFSMFYKFAPRRRTKFREVWVAAAIATLGLQVLQKLFVLYSTNIGDFNRLYGTLGSVVALLMWIYLSGSMIILGGCISAAQYEVNMHLTDQAEAEHS